MTYQELNRILHANRIDSYHMLNVRTYLIKHVVHSSFIQEVAEGNNAEQLRLLIYATHLSQPNS